MALRRTRQWGRGPWVWLHFGAQRPIFRGRPLSPVFWPVGRAMFLNRSLILRAATPYFAREHCWRPTGAGAAGLTWSAGRVREVMAALRRAYGNVARFLVIEPAPAGL